MTNKMEHRNVHGALHREDGPAIISDTGVEFWYKNGELHREGAPAVYRQNTKYRLWYFDGKLHCESGPAVEYSDGTQEYWIHGREVTELEIWVRTKK